MSQNFKWSVKYNGKLDLVIFCIVAAFAMWALFASQSIKAGNNDKLDTILWGPLLMFPITAALIWVVVSMARKKKVPRTMEIDPEKRIMDFTFFNEKKHTPFGLELDEVAYDRIEQSFFTILVMYHKTTATRGHTLYLPMFSIVSFSFSTSWNNRKTYAIINALKELEVESHQPLKRKSIVDYILN